MACIALPHEVYIVLYTMSTHGGTSLPCGSDAWYHGSVVIMNSLIPELFASVLKYYNTSFDKIGPGYYVSYERGKRLPYLESHCLSNCAVMELSQNGTNLSIDSELSC